MRLASLGEPFDHPDWLFELKYDGFRALAHIDPHRCTLVSRNLHVYKPFSDLCEAIFSELAGRTAVVDGEIVCLDHAGRPQFYTLLRRRTPAYFYAFDLVQLDGQDLRKQPLIERKRLLRSLIGPQCSRLLYVDHMDARGIDLFRACCANDLEGIVAKWKYGAYHWGEEQPPDRRLVLHARNPHAASRLTWLKIRNQRYSQMAGRAELFKARTALGQFRP
jgi:bifunctional non-homologous end joining protein LigD